MKSSKSIPTLDDLAFEGRNREYGSYMLRKTYQARLFRSFLYALLIFLFILSLYPVITHLHSAKYDNNSLLDVQVVDVNLLYDPFKHVTIERSGGAALPAIIVPEKIVADEEVITNPAKTAAASDGSVDSTGASGTGTVGNGSGNSNTGGDGMDGELYGSADVNPQFPGGPKAMQEFIKENLHYPEIAQRLNIRGTILIYVVITRDGAIRDVKVVKGLHKDLDNEAMRVVKAMPLWKPAMRGGAAVNVRCTLPISVSPKNSI